MLTYPDEYSLLWFSSKNVLFESHSKSSTVNWISARRLPHKANIDVPVYTRQDLFNMSDVVIMYAKYRVLPIKI